MLIQFSVGNVLSFNDTVKLNMTGANSVKEYENTNTFIDPTNKFKLLKSAALYGANSSGKSNLIKTILTMKNFVLNSFRDALMDNTSQTLSIVPFLLNKECEKKPSFFEIIFIQKNKRYRYGFEVYKNKIHSEWLFFVNTNKEIRLFTRSQKDIDVNKRSFQEGIGLEPKTKENVLFLTVVAQFDGERSNKVIEWFKKLKIVSGIGDIGHQLYTLNLFKTNNKFNDFAKSILKTLDIDDLSTEEGLPDPINFGEPPKSDHLRNLLEAIQKAHKAQGKILKVVSWHKKYDAEQNVIEKIPFDFNTQESEGTKKIISFLGPIFDCLINGYVLIVDELDSRLHPTLTRLIVEFFHIHNFNNAQLIFASHDTNLMKKELFRRDQIWFTEKNATSETDLYSLVEYKETHVRNDASFDKDYLKGKYGAVPFFDDIITEFK
ncbi:MAG: ATP-binding protein [Desulfobacter sp.]|nr:ATP-binding protein [Desulfobacter sp.]